VITNARREGQREVGALRAHVEERPLALAPVDGQEGEPGRVRGHGLRVFIAVEAHERVRDRLAALQARDMHQRRAGQDARVHRE
jgi:hypothetical protein